MCNNILQGSLTFDWLREEFDRLFAAKKKQIIVDLYFGKYFAIQKSIIAITFTEILHYPSKYSSKGDKKESITKLKKTISRITRIHNPENSFK